MKHFAIFAVLACALCACANGDLTPFGDGTVFDSKSGLLWQQTASSNELNWLEAREYCRHLVLGRAMMPGGIDDPASGTDDISRMMLNHWRLPDDSEWRSLIRQGDIQSIDRVAFPQSLIPGWFWTRTAACDAHLSACTTSDDYGAGNEAHFACHVYSSTGVAARGDVADRHHVRCVFH